MASFQPVSTAILSFGMSGQVFHAPFLTVNPRFRFYAVWERSKNLAAQKYPEVKTYRDLGELLKDQAIELVIVNTPNYTHYEYARKALEAGKHVIVEKPFTVTEEEGEALLELAKKQQKILSVYQNRRYDSDFKTIKKVLDQGLLGPVTEAEFHFDRYKLALSPKVHKEMPGPGTGSLYDLGSHLIDQALHLFGQPEAVFADIRKVRPETQVDDYFEVILYYENLRVRLHSSYLVREPLPSYSIHGQNGSFIKARTDIQETMLQASKLPNTADWGKEPETEKGYLHTEYNGKLIKEYIPSLQGHYGEYLDHLYSAIRENGPIPVTAAEGLQVIRIIRRAYESHEKKCVIPLDDFLKPAHA